VTRPAVVIEPARREPMLTCTAGDKLQIRGSAQLASGCKRQIEERLYALLPLEQFSWRGSRDRAVS
jgi:hypothetical protein